jgi:hypothetical protein
MIAVVREMPAPMNRGNLPPRNKVDGGEKRFNTISRWILEHKFAQAAALWAATCGPPFEPAIAGQQ